MTNLRVTIPTLASDLFSVTGPNADGDYGLTFFGVSKSAEYQALIAAGDTTHSLTVSLSDSSGAKSIFNTQTVKLSGFVPPRVGSPPLTPVTLWRGYAKTETYVPGDSTFQLDNTSFLLEGVGGLTNHFSSSTTADGNTVKLSVLASNGMFSWPK